MCWVWTPVVIDFSDSPFCWIVRFLSHTVVVIWFLFPNTFDRIAMISQDSIIHLQLNENQLKSASLNKVEVAQILCELLNFWTPSPMSHWTYVEPSQTKVLSVRPIKPVVMSRVFTTWLDERDLTTIDTHGIFFLEGIFCNKFTGIISKTSSGDSYIGREGGDDNRYSCHRRSISNW